MFSYFFELADAYKLPTCSIDTVYCASDSYSIGAAMSKPATYNPTTHIFSFASLYTSTEPASDPYTLTEPGSLIPEYRVDKIDAISKFDVHLDVYLNASAGDAGDAERLHQGGAPEEREGREYNNKDKGDVDADDDAGSPLGGGKA